MGWENPFVFVPVKPITNIWNDGPIFQTRTVLLSIHLLLSFFSGLICCSSNIIAADALDIQYQHYDDSNYRPVRRRLDSFKDVYSSSDGTMMVLSKEHEIVSSTKTKYDQIQEIIARSKERTTDRMSQLTAVVHVGPMKTGSSGIQQTLGSLHKELKKDAYEFGNSVFQGKLKKMYMCFDTEFLTSNNNNNTNPCDPTVLQLIHDVSVERKHNLVISAEAFARIENNLSLLKEYLNAAGWQKIIIVMFYRRYYDWLLSYFNQGNKYRSIPDRYSIVSFVALQRRLEQRREQTIGGKWGDQYTISEYLLYQQHFNDRTNSEIHLHHMNQIHNGDVREALICTTMGQSTESCKALRRIQQEHKQKHGLKRKFNSHRPLIYEELAYHALHLGLWVEQDDYTLHNVTLMVQHHHEVVNNKTEHDFSIGVTCLDDDIYEWVLNATLQAEEILFPESYTIQGRDEILKEFEQNKHKFCNIDAKAILQAPTDGESNHNNNVIDSVPAETLAWRKFFATLQYQHNI